MQGAPVILTVHCDAGNWSYAHGAFNLRGQKGRLNSFNLTLPFPTQLSSCQVLLLRDESNFPLRSYTEVGHLLTVMFVFLGDSCTPSLGVEQGFEHME